MCGIVGQVRAVGEPVAPGLLASMCAALEHRGPDCRGRFLDGHVGLGIQRLRVVDLETGDQPVFNEDRTIAVVLNGEIYNYRELRRELERSGHRFATEGDTEAIVHLYEEDGPECVRRLHGMFAFALWDERHKILLVARDRVGKKPLFYSHRGATLSFASEMAALLQDADIPRELDYDALDCYLAFGYVPAPYSAFRAVRKLPPAHTMVWRDGRLAVSSYWRHDFSRKLELEEGELVDAVRASIRSATRRRMIADVPLGAFLSGGIDSSAVVAAMAEISPQPVKTFSIGFENERFDELVHARRIAELFGTDHHEFVVDYDQQALLPKIVRHFGEPFADSSAVPSFHLASLTREHVTVALNGDGGDEAFGGYSRYVANRYAARLDRVPAAMRGAAAALAARVPRGERETALAQRVARLARTMPLKPHARYASYVAIFDDDARAELCAGPPDKDSPADRFIEQAWGEASGAVITDRMLEVDATTYLPGDLIPKIDIATMAYGLEARSPLLDHELVELAAQIPAHLKVRGTQTKWILREAMRGRLPDDILDRPKQGFQVPIGDWLRGELRGYARDVLLDPRSLGRGLVRPAAISALLERHDRHGSEAHRLWSLLMLELWQREFVDAPLRAPAPASALIS